MQRVDGGAFFKKSRIVPGVVEIPDHRSGARRFLCEESHRVCLFSLVPVFIGVDMELVQSSLADAGDKAFTDYRLAASLQWMGLGAPAIEAATHAYRQGV